MSDLNQKFKQISFAIQHLDNDTDQSVRGLLQHCDEIRISKLGDGMLRITLVAADDTPVGNVVAMGKDLSIALNYAMNGATAARRGDVTALPGDRGQS
jgi:hypothetical protein